MRNKEVWQPTKFEVVNNKLRASRNENNVSVSSRLMVDTVAGFYNKVIPAYVKGFLLDLGCGYVPLYKAYEPFTNDIFCVDWGNSLHRNSYLDIETDLNKPLPLENDTYETVILSDVLEHIRLPESLLKEINRIMKPKGYLLLNVPFYYWLHEEPFDYFRYTKYALRNMLEANGFEIVSLEELGGIPEVIADILAKFWVGFPVIGKFLAKFIQWKTKIFLKISIGKRISKKTANQFPLAYGVVAIKK